MTREIKFRAWSESKKMMAMGIEREYDTIAGVRYFKNGVETEEEPYCDCFNSYLKDKDFIVMQFTGLKDKNGKEIYEGDYVKFRSEGRLRVFPVIWGEYTDNEYVSKLECWCVDGTPLSCLVYGTGVKYGRGHETKDGVVIFGNIYETPELLTRGIK